MGEVRSFGAAWRQCLGQLVVVALFSCAINLLYLASPLYLTQVYSRVVTSGSLDTLVLLTGATLAALVCLAGLHGVRAAVLVDIGLRLDRLTAEPLLLAGASADGDRRGAGDGLRDLDTVRQFVSGSGVVALLDAPWLPLYLGILFLVHPWIGLLCTAGAGLLLLLMVASEVLTRRAYEDADLDARRSYGVAEEISRNAEAVRTMGMLAGHVVRWRTLRDLSLARSAHGGNRAAWLDGASRLLRLALQTSVVGLGAYLVIGELLNPGVIFASMVLSARALAPVEQAIAAWRPWVHAREAAHRIGELVKTAEDRSATTRLPLPRGRVAIEGLIYKAGERSEPVVAIDNLVIEPGEALGIVGPTAAGKTTLARLLVGFLKPTAGTVRLDGADVRQWDAQDFGRFVGYMPQAIRLLTGTLAENIARFGEAPGTAVVDAAQQAGAHSNILALPRGYETVVGEQTPELSGGQRQLVGLARAVFGNPVLVVLDEPTAHLDRDGDAAVMQCINVLRQRRCTTILITHDLRLLGSVDKVLVLNQGRPAMYGPRDQALAELMKRSMRPVSGVA